MTRSHPNGHRRATHLLAIALVLGLAGCSPSDGGRGAREPAAQEGHAPAAGTVTECRVPDVGGQPYDAARRALLAAGWQPLPIPPGTDRTLDGLHRLGVVEVASCDPTGAGTCLMKFRDAQGDTLDVTTIGGQGVDTDGDGRIGRDEMPTVRDLRPTCQA